MVDIHAQPPGDMTLVSLIENEMGEEQNEMRNHKDDKL